SDDLPALNVLPFANDRFLVHAGAGVRPHEFAKFVYVDSCLRIVFQLLFALWQMAVLRNYNLVGSNRGDLAAFDGEYDRMRIARDFLLETGAHQRHLGNN